MAVLGLIRSPMAFLTIPGALLEGFAFAAAGLAATTFVRGWQDFDLVQLVLQPLFLFSGTFFPIDLYPEPLRIAVQLTPLYHAVALLRAMTLGVVDPGVLVDVVYLAAMGLIGLLIVSRRLDKLLLR
jgi:lipooligosaccharide transport system permease protein